MIANNDLDVYIGTNIKIISEEKAIKCLFCNFNLFLFVEWLKKQSHQVHLILTS